MLSKIKNDKSILNTLCYLEWIKIVDFVESVNWHERETAKSELTSKSCCGKTVNNTRYEM